MQKKKINNPIIDSDVLNDWDYEKNIGLKPEDFSAGSNKRVWWKCHKCGYSWNTTISNRASSGRCCPSCSESGHAVHRGYNDLLTTNPKLAAEWHPTKNDDLKASDIRENSGKKVWWLCPHGHSYQATPNHRSNGHTGCPVCNSGRHTSFAEQAVYFYIKKLFPSAINSYREIFEKGMELDIFIPEINVGIEYDGAYWHRKREKTIEREKRKYQICKNNNIKLIRVKEKINSFEYINADCAFSLPVNAKGNEALNQVIMLLLRELDPESNMWTRKNPKNYFSKIIPDVEKDRFEILSYLAGPIKNSLQDVNPIIAEEWNFEKNGDLKPSMVAAGSSLKVFWKCKKCGYEWETEVSHRALENTRCPNCAGLILNVGVNDLASKCPDLLLDWDYEKNKNLGIEPSNVLFNSGKKVHWKCHKCGYEWQRAINSRSVNNLGCIKCGYKKNIETKKKNNIALKGTLSDSKLLKEWDYDKNYPNKPSDFPLNSSYNAHWVCSICRHEWTAPIGLRVKGQRGCRKCADKANPQLLRKNRIANGNAITDEKLLKEWDYDKNYPNKPSDFSSGSGAKFSWICSKCGYTWEATINSRSRGSGCPNCAGQVCVSGKNDLKTKYPRIAKEWDYEMNGAIKPEDILPRSNKKYWWICPNGHESYMSTPGHRIDGTGCPICAKSKISTKNSIKIDQYTEDFRYLKTFSSAKEAEMITGISRSSICQSIRRNGIAGGFRWKKADKKNQ